MKITKPCRDEEQTVHKRQYHEQETIEKLNDEELNEIDLGDAVESNHVSIQY